MLHNQNDEHLKTCVNIVRRLQQLNQQPATTPITSKPINGDHRRPLDSDSGMDPNLQETIGQLEDILHHYRRELRQPTNSGPESLARLITRLVDVIRPMYSADVSKMNALETLYDEISALNAKKSLDQKDKNEQLQEEISHLKKLVITSSNQSNPMTSLCQMSKSERARKARVISAPALDMMMNHDEWMGIDKESRKLHELVQLQRRKIDELVQILAEVETSTPKPKTSPKGVPAPTAPASRNEPPPIPMRPHVQRPSEPTYPVIPHAGTHALPCILSTSPFSTRLSYSSARAESRTGNDPHVSDVPSRVQHYHDDRRAIRRARQRPSRLTLRNETLLFLLLLYHCVFFLFSPGGKMKTNE